MISENCQRLAEVGFPTAAVGIPIAELSRRAAMEKSIQHGHAGTLAIRAETP